MDDTESAGGDDSGEATPTRDDVVDLDSAQLRCLAHPLRARLLGSLRAHGPATASHLAVRLGTNSGATSYHLRQLNDVGLVGDVAELGRGRERYWRALHTFSRWSSGRFEADPQDRAAMTWLLGFNDRLKSTWRAEWLQARGDHDGSNPRTDSVNGEHNLPYEDTVGCLRPSQVLHGPKT